MDYVILNEREFAERGCNEESVLVQVSFPNQELGPLYLDVSLLYVGESEKIVKKEDKIIFIVKERGYNFEELKIDWFFPRKLIDNKLVK
jgi:hypothetical protein